MLERVVEIDNLKRIGRVMGDQVPDPIGSVAQSDSREGAIPAAPVALCIDAPPKLFYRLDGAIVGGGIRIADRIGLGVPGGPGKDPP
jgi:hypothetical protein